MYRLVYEEIDWRRLGTSSWFVFVVERRVFILLLGHDGPGSVRLSLAEGIRSVLFYGLTGLATRMALMCVLELPHMKLLLDPALVF